MDVIQNIYKDDDANYQKSKKELGDEIKLIDDALALYIEPGKT